MVELHLVVFYLNNELYGVESSQVKQIIKYQEGTKIPDMPNYVEGILSLRGRDITVINLNMKFGYAQSEITKKTKIIISEIESRLLGFVVDDITELTKIEEDEIEILPDVVRLAGNSYLKKVAKREDAIISILDLEAVLGNSDFLNSI